MAGSHRLQTLIREIQEIGKIVTGSSIYKRFLNSRMEDLNSELIFVVKLETQKNEIQVFDFLRKKEMISPRFGMSKPETYTMLAFDQNTRLVPGENLPSPLLHQDPLTLRCASDAWGSFEHPVLGQTLNELVKSHQSVERTEFYSQFLNPNQ